MSEHSEAEKSVKSIIFGNMHWLFGKNRQRYINIRPFSVHFWKDLEILCLEICQFEKKFNRLKSNFGNFSYDADWTTVEVDA